ncbi:MAG: hypoxanthine phosphoribosyltransferase [Oscillospiraceae bacterium]|nr:hypoxanthine phosphoribosyltransferase [Oscillospiraceae bacterium]
MYFPNEVENILFTEEQIKTRVKELGAELTKEYSGKNPLFLCVLRGASVFFADLIRSVECPLEIDFIKASSYVGTDSSGEVRVGGEIPDISGRDVVLVEDIVDTARTLSKLKTLLLGQDPGSLKVAALLDKPSRRTVEGFKADYTGYEIDDLFVVGYGLDCDMKFRNLPYIGVLKS